MGADALGDYTNDQKPTILRQFAREESMAINENEILEDLQFNYSDHATHNSAQRSKQSNRPDSQDFNFEWGDDSFEYSALIKNIRNIRRRCTNNKSIGRSVPIKQEIKDPLEPGYFDSINTAP